MEGRGFGKIFSYRGIESPDLWLLDLYERFDLALLAFQCVGRFV
jgi:hypothetical protein